MPWVKKVDNWVKGLEVEDLRLSEAILGKVGLGYSLDGYEKLKDKGLV